RADVQGTMPKFAVEGDQQFGSASCSGHVDVAPGIPARRDRLAELPRRPRIIRGHLNRVLVRLARLHHAKDQADHAANEQSGQQDRPQHNRGKKPFPVARKPAWLRTRRRRERRGSVTITHARILLRIPGPAHSEIPWMSRQLSHEQQSSFASFSQGIFFGLKTRSVDSCPAAVCGTQGRKPSNKRHAPGKKKAQTVLDSLRDPGYSRG